MKRVLVVDDTKNIRMLLSKCLELEGYEVYTASDGQEAMEMFKTRPFDLAFLDIKMPLFSGTEVLRQIREMGVHTPVIIITAYATVKNAVECTQMGAVAYLQKPFTADKVRTVLSEIFQLPCEEPSVTDWNHLLDEVENAIQNHSNDQAIQLLNQARKAFGQYKNK